MRTYEEFLASKSQVAAMGGFEPNYLPDCLKGFQRSLVEWSVRRGRAEVAADCGLGKTLQQLVCAENVVRHTNKSVLVLTPLTVASQTVREGQKFGIDCVRSHRGEMPSGARIVVANYDRLHLFTPSNFVGGVADEAGCLKNFDAKRTAEVTEFLRTLPYRYLFTATPAPNDYVELGTAAEALGEMGYQDMLSKFFRQQTSKDHLGWGRTKYILRGHAGRDFWRWVCSWMRACRKPSDMGFENGEFVLPELRTEEYVVVSRTKRPGILFDLPAITLDEQREERRRTLVERCEMVAELTAETPSSIAWGHLNDECDLMEKLIPGAIQIDGKDTDEAKEEKILALTSGQARVLVTKPVLAGFGLNLQHCAHMTFFPSHSYELFYQSVRRCWRFGQTQPVQVDMISSEGERGVLENLRRKESAADAMFTQLIELMNDQLNIHRSNPFTQRSALPSWIQEKAK